MPDDLAACLVRPSSEELKEWMQQETSGDLLYVPARLRPYLMTDDGFYCSTACSMSDGLSVT